MNSKTANGMKCVLTLFGLMALVLPAEGASFDCAKAGSKVEHIICDNPEISKLDDELASDYKTVLQDQSKANTIRREQKQWLIERNECADAGCVRETYRKRIEQLHPSQNAVAQPQAVAAIQPRVMNAVTTASSMRYPPYPDIWDWVMPDREKIDATGIQLVGMDTGDVLFQYSTHDKNGNWVNHQPFTLFAHLSVTDAYASQKIFGHDLPVAHLSDGSSAKLESRDDANKFIEQGILLTGGRKLNQTSFTPIGTSYSSCYFGPAHYLYGITGLDRKQIKGVVIFKLLDKPKHIDIGEGCISGPMEAFTTRVESIDAGLRARPLADGGFVMEVEKGVLIRFDKDFNSRSPLINDKYFVVDDTGEVPGDTDGWIYINRITGKTYRQAPEYSYDYQSVVDDLYNYLITLKSKKGASK